MKTLNDNACQEGASYELSICIATRNRCTLLLQTLKSAMAQAGPRVEIVIVDGASTDATFELMTDFVSQYSNVRYFRETANGGIDQDYDKSVLFATGTYCWLMSDDDLFLPGAISRVLGALQGAPSLVVVDAQVCDATISKVLLERRLNLETDQYFKPNELEQTFNTIGRQLSFIGSTIIKRSLWISRERKRYFGSFFIHVGVIFQAELPNGALVLKQPCLSIRYGNASWTGRAFEIWMIKWPELIWSLTTLSSTSKSRVVTKRPYDSVKELALLRAKGAYSMVEYRQWLKPTTTNCIRQALYASIALMPGVLVNSIAIAYVMAFSRARSFALIDLQDSKYYLLRLVRSAK